MAWSDFAAAEEKEGSRSSSSNLKTTQGLGGGNGEGESLQSSPLFTEIIQGSCKNHKLHSSRQALF